MNQNKGLLKDRLIEAPVCGELGSIEDRGIVFTIKDFKSVFVDIKTDYINSFLPAAAIEPGRETMTRTKFLFRVRKGVCRVHPYLLSASEKKLRSDGLINQVLKLFCCLYVCRHDIVFNVAARCPVFYKISAFIFGFNFYVFKTRLLHHG